MLKLKQFLSVFTVLALAVTFMIPARPVSARETEPPASPQNLANRVVGYLPSYRMSTVDSIDYSALSHVVLSFLTYANGTLSTEFSAADIERIKANCDQEGVKLMIAIGGWNGFTYSNNPVDTAAERTTLVNSIMNYVDKYDLDGVDIDIEITDGAFWSHFDAFMAELSAELKADGKLLTMAVSQWFTDPIENSTYDYFDFINLMSYDYSHTNVAPMSQVTTMLGHYFAKGISDDRMTVGVPFYGYDENGGAYTYSQIIGMNEYANFFDTCNGISYNGEETIRTKAELSKEYGGIMIWELGQDSFGEYSLLADIKEVMSTGGNISNVAPVTDLTVTGTTTSMVALTWAASADAVCYKIYEGINLIGTTSIQSFIATGLSARTSYTFKVMAVNAAGESSRVVKILATTPAGTEGDYERWDGGTRYSQNDYVVFKGKIYKAKWWSHGTAPDEGESYWNAWEYIGEASETILLSTKAVTVTEGEMVTILAGITPSGIFVSWQSADTSIASVSDGGVITGMKAGTTVITATTPNGVSASCTVTVNEKAATELGFATFKIGTLDVYHSHYGVVQASVQTIIRDGRAYVAMREGAAVCDAQCDYTEENGSGKIMLTYPEYKAEFTIGGTAVNLYFLSGELYQTVQIPADQVPVIVDGRTYLPARVLGQISCVTGRTYIYYISNAQTGGIGEYVIYTTGEAAEAQLKAMAQTADTAFNA